MCGALRLSPVRAKKTISWGVRSETVRRRVLGETRNSAAQAKQRRNFHSMQDRDGREANLQARHFGPRYINRGISWKCLHLMGEE